MMPFFPNIACRELSLAPVGPKLRRRLHYN
jgi:hypothetical protein